MSPSSQTRKWGPQTQGDTRAPQRSGIFQFELVRRCLSVDAGTASGCKILIVQGIRKMGKVDAAVLGLTIALAAMQDAGPIPPVHEHVKHLTRVGGEMDYVWPLEDRHTFRVLV
jgi:hypothetical protein